MKLFGCSRRDEATSSSTRSAAFSRRPALCRPLATAYRRLLTTPRSHDRTRFAAARTIDRSQLNETDQLAYDVFEYAAKDSLEGLSPALLSLTAVRPLNHFSGFQTFYPTFANGKGAAPFKTVLDYDNNLKRHTDYVKWVDQVIGRFREGEASGVVETKMTIRNVIEQLDNQLAQKTDARISTGR